MEASQVPFVTRSSFIIVGTSEALSTNRVITTYITYMAVLCWMNFAFRSLLLRGKTEGQQKLGEGLRRVLSKVSCPKVLWKRTL